MDVLIVLSTFAESGGYSGDESAGEREVSTFLMVVMAGDAFGWWKCWRWWATFLSERGLWR